MKNEVDTLCIRLPKGPQNLMGIRITYTPSLDGYVDRQNHVTNCTFFKKNEIHQHFELMIITDNVIKDIHELGLLGN